MNCFLFLVHIVSHSIHSQESLYRPPAFINNEMECGKAFLICANLPGSAAL